MKKLILISFISMALIVVSANANLLVDPGFELNPLTTASNVLNNFTGFQGKWGYESGSIVGAENGITPAQGSLMHRMETDNITWTQTFESTNVTSYAALIDNGNATVNISGLFNADSHLSAAISSVSVLFFTVANFGSQIGSPASAGLTLDNQPGTWQTVAASGNIPIGTRWLITQVAYQNASLLGSDGAYHSGYVDATDLTIVPEPMTLVLLTLGGWAMRYKKKCLSC